MQEPNVKELNLEEMLSRSEITVGILRVVYALQEVKDYTKENVAQDLIKVLSDMGYLGDPLEVKK
ncbi:hypothetical protein [Oceanobacillus chungangensis]|uniref:Uncharacterized protein n=1 Tax=Oceanobacillus chungangensis TaxID=1229152 RepID=A0A3D8PIP5_9BACI|nr:hypothetical protein [Oceanobacillus chungangensis]RDW15960.1 hypothetical protein CWR45_15815 [Oceanobacillus chungangensis]